MLVELRVRDLGVIEDVSLQLGPGMTALTGETGAGKTLLVEALELLLGSRADSTLVRAGATEAFVEGRFEGVADEDEKVGEARETERILGRSLPASGRSRSWVDGMMATQATLSEAGANLVDLHGQHSHQSLLDVAQQRAALDAFGQVDSATLAEARTVVGTSNPRSATSGETSGNEHARSIFCVIRSGRSEPHG